MITTDTPRHQEVEKGRPRHLESLITVPLPRIIFIALCLGALAVIPPGFSQEASIAPYATINHDAVNYNGPGRDARHDLAGADTRIGLLLPLSGPRQCEGEALQRAAQLAVDEANATSLPGVNRLLLVVRDESGPWGQASNQIVNLIFDDQAVALITSGEGGSAHLAEQVGNKVGVPILALSTDSTTTEINLPWIFRLGPTDAAQAQAFAADIYQRRKLQRVVLLSQNDRDGGLGGDAFIKAAAALHVPAPVQIVVDPGKIDEALAGQALGRRTHCPTPSDPSAQTAIERTYLPVPQRGPSRRKCGRPPALFSREQLERQSLDRRRPGKPASSRRFLQSISSEIWN